MGAQGGCNVVPGKPNSAAGGAPSSPERHSLFFKEKKTTFFQETKPAQPSSTLAAIPQGAKSLMEGRGPAATMPPGMHVMGKQGYVHLNHGLTIPFAEDKLSRAHSLTTGGSLTPGRGNG